MVEKLIANSFEKGLIIRLAETMKDFDVKESQLKHLQSEHASLNFRAGKYSAMLSDICEVLFGGRAGGSPMMLCHIHGGWSCGPMSKPDEQTFVECFYDSRKIVMTNKEKTELEEWKKFLLAIKSTYKRGN